ncbi:MAG: hypothetical protein LBH93_06465 [Chitinispirillales bacterium]|jgi:hypothetical protein|nr:hypothetical protein [Chitinispirillales bacterium]
MDADAEDEHQEEEEGKYEIYDRKSLNLLADGELKEKDGKYVIERIVPDSQDAVIFVDGWEMRTRLIANQPKQEIVSIDQIKETYWTYGEDYTCLSDAKDGGENDI